MFNKDIDKTFMFVLKSYFIKLNLQFRNYMQVKSIYFKALIIVLVYFLYESYCFSQSKKLVNSTESANKYIEYTDETFSL